MIRCAKRVIAQNFDDLAIGDAAARALLNHPFKLGLERSEPQKPAFNFRQLRFGNGVGGGTGLVWGIRQGKKIANCL
jgi:hypothetical protein